ncbi:MAG: hypothetical protein M3540_09635 [Actinomycetota bacterium]|nr:hypothetical protein [Actinomycetota bacterium]
MNAALAIVAALEALEAGDVPLCEAILLGALDDGPTERPISCPYCPATFAWPGLRDTHVVQAHPDELVEGCGRAA